MTNRIRAASDSGAAARDESVPLINKNQPLVILSAKREESPGIPPLAHSVGILQPLKRVQNDTGVYFY